MLSKLRRFQKLFAIAAIGMAVSLTAVDFAEARRASGGSSFGSRGTRTFAAPPTTNTAPGAANGINRSMTPNTQQNAASPANGMGAQAAQQRRPGMFGGMFGGILGGLALGGLFGMLMGNGFGGMAGMLGMLLQIALIAGLAMLAFRFFARRQQQQAAGPAGNARAYGNGGNDGFGRDQEQNHAYQSQQNQGGFQIPKIGSGSAGFGGAQQAAPRQAGADTDEIGITGRDLGQFEKLLTEIQGAYAAEDYAKLRSLTTPEAMSYLAEELGENATNGVKNEVKDVKLLQGDLAEAWRENGQEYATVAMRYSSIDFLRDRNNGQVVDGDPNHETETVEVWTFVRKPANDWQLSAIQSAA